MATFWVLAGIFVVFTSRWEEKITEQSILYPCREILTILIKNRGRRNWTFCFKGSLYIMYAVFFCSSKLLQQKRQWCTEQSFGLCGRGRGWDDLGEWHWNMYNIIYEMSCQSRFDARYWMLGAGALGRPRGMVRGGRREEGSGWGTRVYLWQIHFDIWQNQYNIVKLNKIKFKKNNNQNY